MAKKIKFGLSREWHDPSIKFRLIFKMRLYNNTEVAGFYNVDPRTLETYIKELLKDKGPKIGKYYTIRHLEHIFNTIGPPYDVIQENG